MHFSSFDWKLLMLCTAHLLIYCLICMQWLYHEMLAQNGCMTVYGNLQGRCCFWFSSQMIYIICTWRCKNCYNLGAEKKNCSKMSELSLFLLYSTRPQIYNGISILNSGWDSVFLSSTSHNEETTSPTSPNCVALAWYFMSLGISLLGWCLSSLAKWESYWLWKIFGLDLQS